MTLLQPDFSLIKEGDSCKDQFRVAYENRYTWPNSFSGYYGRVKFKSTTDSVEGSFNVDSKLKFQVDDINNEIIRNSISSQLWEVTIHRVRRSFAEVHKDNTFTLGGLNENGYEIIVGGKNQGDCYRIKNGYISMVYRNIHGKYVLIYTQDIIDTNSGYLSRKYTSEYKDPSSGVALSPKSHYEDKFTPLFKDRLWVLTKRTIQGQQENAKFSQSFEFTDLKKGK